MRVIATALAQRAVSLLHQAQPKPQPLTSSIFGSMVSSSAIPGRGSAAAASTSSSSSCAGVHHQMLCAHDGGARPTAEHGAHDGSPRQSGRSPAPVRPGRPRLQPPAPPAPGPPAQACTTRCYARTTGAVRRPPSTGAHGRPPLTSQPAAAGTVAIASCSTSGAASSAACSAVRVRVVTASAGRVRVAAASAAREQAALPAVQPSAHLDSWCGLQQRLLLLLVLI